MKKVLAGRGDCVQMRALGANLVTFAAAAALMACGEAKPAEEPQSVMSTESPPPVIIVAAPAPTVTAAPTASTVTPVAPGTTVTQSTTTTTVAH
jgi:multidrug efflux pump subunit AcrA (membrane-fusion protein)